jgi:hypothetical protein
MRDSWPPLSRLSREMLLLRGGPPDFVSKGGKNWIFIPEEGQNKHIFYFFKKIYIFIKVFVHKKNSRGSYL